MMQSLKIALLAIAILAEQVTSIWAADPRGKRWEHLEGGYSVQIPADLRIAQTSTMNDFVLYKVTDSKQRELLVIYLGNFPDTRIKAPKHSVRSSASIAGCPATSDRWTGKDETFNGMTLIQLINSGRWPTNAHMLFRDLSKDDAEVAEGIVRSFRRDPAPDRK
ncbi:MAG: hypothetical protein ACJ8R9_25870 [Steroidobacteraceae bacterium]